VVTLRPWDFRRQEKSGKSGAAFPFREGRFTTEARRTRRDSDPFAVWNKQQFCSMQVGGCTDHAGWVCLCASFDGHADEKWGGVPVSGRKIHHGGTENTEGFRSFGAWSTQQFRSLQAGGGSRRVGGFVRSL
jgi:hypothetical protein